MGNAPSEKPNSFVRATRALQDNVARSGPVAGARYSLMGAILHQLDLAAVSTIEPFVYSSRQRKLLLELASSHTVSSALALLADLAKENA